MNDKFLFNILLAIDDSDDLVKTEELLIQVNQNSMFNYQIFNVVSVGTVVKAMETLNKSYFDIIICDLRLEDKQDESLVEALKDLTVDYPIILLANSENHEIAMDALQGGFQDFIAKDRLDAEILLRAMRYSIDRHKLTSAIRHLSLIDELTGLYNRRGFVTMGENHLKIVNRRNQGAFLFFVDLSDMHKVNEEFGYKEGDRYLIDFSNILRRSIRTSDILGRHGGDEFVFLCVDNQSGDDQTILKRLRQNIDFFNQTAQHKIDLKIGVSFYKAEEGKHINQVIDEAAQNLLDQQG